VHRPLRRACQNERKEQRSSDAPHHLAPSFAAVPATLRRTAAPVKSRERQLCR
jgi:hypothetical protein